MEVRIYDRDLNFKGVIENHTSLIWTRKYYEPGNFEIHAPITEQKRSSAGKAKEPPAYMWKLAAAPG